MSNNILKNKGKARALVFTCIDPRFISQTTTFLNGYKDLHQDYDLFVLAGSELGALTNENFNTVLDEHIQIAIDLHKIKKIICISHMDCGYYKIYYEKKKDDDIHQHQENQLKLKDAIKDKYPKLKFESYIMDTDGNIHKNKI